MEQSAGVSYRGQEPTTTVLRRGSIWAYVEQEYRSEFDDSADIRTAMAMLQSVTQYQSAIDQLYADCVYASIAGDVVTIKLDVTVWLSSMDLQYGLTVNQGSISGPSTANMHRSFDVIFDGSAYAEMPFNFTGTLSPLMPKYTPLGALSQATFEIFESTVEASEPLHTVLRANGIAHGYTHTITLTFNKSQAGAQNRIKNVSCEVTLTYQDGSGETAVKILQLKVPTCAADLLEWCDNDRSIGGGTKIDDNEPTLWVWYSTCEDDDVLKTESIEDD